MEFRRHIADADEEENQDSHVKRFQGNENDYQAEILNKEQELLRKAKDLEREMQSIKQAKIDVIVK